MKHDNRNTKYFRGRWGAPNAQEDDRPFPAPSSAKRGHPWLRTLLQENSHRRESEAAALIPKSGHFGLLVSVAQFCLMCKIGGNGLWLLFHLSECGILVLLRLLAQDVGGPLTRTMATRGHS